MSIIFKTVTMPTNCVGCRWRDAEAGNQCELMPNNPFRSYDEQYRHCPLRLWLEIATSEAESEIRRTISELQATGLSWRDATARERAAYLTALLDVEIALLGGENNG